MNARALPRLLAWLAIAAGAALAAREAAAEVRFGRNVRIGGHDFSHQTYGPKRRAVIHLHRSRPTPQGCRWFPAGAVVDGRRLTARTRICHLQTIPPGRR